MNSYGYHLMRQWIHGKNKWGAYGDKFCCSFLIHSRVSYSEKLVARACFKMWMNHLLSFNTAHLQWVRQRWLQRLGRGGYQKLLNAVTPTLIYSTPSSVQVIESVPPLPSPVHEQQWTGFGIKSPKATNPNYKLKHVSLYTYKHVSLCTCFPLHIQSHTCQLSWYSIRLQLSFWAMHNTSSNIQFALHESMTTCNLLLKNTTGEKTILYVNSLLTKLGTF